MPTGAECLAKAHVPSREMGEVGYLWGQPQMFTPTFLGSVIGSIPVQAVDKVPPTSTPGLTLTQKTKSVLEQGEEMCELELILIADVSLKKSTDQSPHSFRVQGRSSGQLD